ncbi:MAG TPA: DUF4097 family beta strand repeat-containing protein [Vicinamibacterales bacterium]|nr:DUF4097 family beta strand repeat-containing protein [Vicinamibacterales bacterium]
MHIRLAGVLCLALLLGACDVKVGEHGLSVDMAHGKAGDEWKRTYSLPPGGRLEILNINGVIEAFPSSGTQVEVVARREVRASSDEAAQELLAKAQMIEEVAADHVKIELKTDPDSGPGGLRSRNQVSIAYQVGLPPGLNVSLRTENGAVRLENVQGRFAVASTNGPLVGKGISGSMDATTVNGGIQMELTAVTGDSKVVTVNGPVTLALAPDVNGELEAGAINGGVFVQDGFPLTASERTMRRVAGRINKGGPRIVVQTTNGGVRVGTPDGVARGFGRGRRGRDSSGG